jgi:hypothetical protein
MAKNKSEIKCPACNKMTPSSSKFCFECGTKMPVVAAAGTPVAAATATTAAAPKTEKPDKEKDDIEMMKFGAEGSYTLSFQVTKNGIKVSKQRVCVAFSDGTSLIVDLDRSGFGEVEVTFVGARIRVNARWLGTQANTHDEYLAGASLQTIPGGYSANVNNATNYYTTPVRVIDCHQK